MDVALPVLHGVFFALIPLRRASHGLPRRDEARRAPIARTAAHTPHAAALVFVGVVVGVVFYLAVILALTSGRVTRAVTARGVIGALVVVFADVLMAWSLFTLRSWRLEPNVDPGHELCTTGPYGLVRHPIYLAVDLLVLATALWAPTPLVITMALVLVVGCDVRARLEERVLVQAFGHDYVTYMGKVRRLVPGIY